MIIEKAKKKIYNQSIYNYSDKFGRGRVCKYNGCGTILNIHNPGKYCSLHTRKIWEERSKRMKKD